MTALGPSLRCGSNHAAINAVTRPATRRERAPVARRASHAPPTSAIATSARSANERVSWRSPTATRNAKPSAPAANPASETDTGPRLSVRLAVIGRLYGQVSRREARAEGFGQAGTMASSDRVRVGVLAPMKSELRPVVRAFGLQPAVISGVAVHSGAVGNADIVATTTGIGTALATAARPNACSVSETSTACW